MEQLPTTSLEKKYAQAIQKTQGRQHSRLELHVVKTYKNSNQRNTDFLEPNICRH